MTFDPQLLDALEELVGKWSGTVWRVVVEGTGLLRPNQRGARWNPPLVEALYCSLTPETARKELEHVLASQPMEVTRKRVLHKLSVQLERVLYLRDPDVLSEFGFGKDVILGDEHSMTQYLGAAIHWLGCAAVIVPSARHEGHNMVVFPENIGEGDEFEPAG